MYSFSKGPEVSKVFWVFDVFEVPELSKVSEVSKVPEVGASVGQVLKQGQGKGQDCPSCPWFLRCCGF